MSIFTIVYYSVFTVVSVVFSCEHGFLMNLREHWFEGNVLRLFFFGGAATETVAQGHWMNCTKQPLSALPTPGNAVKRLAFVGQQFFVEIGSSDTIKGILFSSA